MCCTSAAFFVGANSSGIVSVCAALLGAVVGGCISYLNVNRMAVANARQTAIAEFHAVFANTTAAYDMVPKHQLGECQLIFKNDLPKQASAIENFRRFVAPHKREAYQAAWDKYYRTAVTSCFAMENSNEFKEQTAGILKFAEK